MLSYQRPVPVPPKGATYKPRNVETFRQKVNRASNIKASNVQEAAALVGLIENYLGQISRHLGIKQMAETASLNAQINADMITQAKEQEIKNMDDGLRTDHIKKQDIADHIPDDTESYSDEDIEARVNQLKKSINKKKLKKEDASKEEAELEEIVPHNV